MELSWRLFVIMTLLTYTSLIFYNPCSYLVSKYLQMLPMELEVFVFVGLLVLQRQYYYQLTSKRTEERSWHKLVHCAIPSVVNLMLLRYAYLCVYLLALTVLQTLPLWGEVIYFVSFSILLNFSILTAWCPGRIDLWLNETWTI